MPPHSPSELASQPESINMPPVCCDRFGLGMAKGLLPESSRSPPGKLDSRATMLLDRVAELAMGWVKKWVHLWQNFSRTLMKAVLMGIAKGACRLAAAVPLGKAETLGEKELGRGKCKMDDRGALSCKMNHQGYLILSSLEGWPREDVESLIEDVHFGECPEELFIGAKMGSMDLEDNTDLHLICHTISVDFESDSESSSNEDVELEGAEHPGSFSQKTSEDLDIRGYFEASCSPHEEFGDFDSDLEGDSRECLESPFVSQECRESVERSEDLVMFEEESVESTSDSEDWEHLSQCGKAKENLGTPTGSYGFKSPLVLSLFYCPSEEDDDNDSEDWSSEDEMEKTGQAYLDGAVSENGVSSAAQHQDFPENFCGSIQSTAFTSPEPKKHKEVTISFHLRKADSKPEEFWNPPKPSSPKDQSPATGHPPHHCCQRETESSHDLVTTETFQKESQMVKKVRFSPEVTVHTLVVWDYASRAARRGPWEEMARDRCRFQRRIAEVGAILAPCLEMEHRAKAWRKIHGALEFVRLENTENTLHSSAERKKIC